MLIIGNNSPKLNIYKDRIIGDELRQVSTQPQMKKLVRSRATDNSDKDHKLKKGVNNHTEIVLINSIRILKFTSKKAVLSAIISIVLLMQNLESNPGPTSTTNLSVVTFNCNGLGDFKKLRKLLTKLHPMVEKNCIVQLQETHCIYNEALEKLWKHKLINNGFKSNSTGVMVLFNKNYEIQRVFKDKVGRQIIAAMPQLTMDQLI
jgi:hypothetical protein